MSTLITLYLIQLSLSIFNLHLDTYYSNKKEFLLSLIPFYYILNIIKSMKKEYDNLN